MPNDYYSRGQSGLISVAAENHRAQMDEQLRASQAAQQRYFADNPVKPNPPPPSRPLPGRAAPVASDMSTAADALMPPEYRAPVTDTPGNPYVPPPQVNAQPIQPIPQPPQMKPLVASEVLQVRGPVQSAVQSSAGPNTSIRDANEAARAELNVMRAREAQDGQSRMNAMLQNANQADAWTDRQKAEGEARAANFRAANGADMILRGGNPEQKQAIIQQAAMANANLAGATARQTAANQPLPQRNFIQEAVQGEGAIEGSATARDNRLTAATNRAGAAIGQQSEQQKLDQQKRISEASSKLLEAKTPEEREQLQQSILTMLGKDAKDGTRVVPISMPDSTNEMGAVMKGGQAVAVISPDGKVQIVKMGDNGQQPGAATPPKPATPDLALNEARAAIAKGADKAAVNARLKSWGYPEI